MTHRELAHLILSPSFSEDQKDSDLTIVNMNDQESFRAKLSFVSDDKNDDDFGLDDGHPFFCCQRQNQPF